MENRDRIAQAFVAARRDARGLAQYPGDRPTTLGDAYGVQDRAIALDGRTVVGWKVGKINAPLDTQLGANRLAGPIFADQLFLDATPVLPVIADGFAAAEAEYCIRIARSPAPGATGLSHDAVLELIDAVHVGIEIASSPYPGINADGPLVTISDYGNNHGLLVGAEIPGWRDGDFIDWPVVSRIDGAVIGKASARTMLDGPIGAVSFLIDCLASRGLTLAAGQWVSSGAVTGVHPVAPGQRFDAEFGSLRVSCAIDAARPAQGMQGELSHASGAE
ncbi:2-keto-4-pentenoate hydratase [Sphingomonas sp. Leaf407]|uniref:2-keto-4-pentenoate hydratase n=1 Tax=unclassified Sphingomonas TaxID=196159 RepID=UPI0006F819DF|nr:MULTISPECIES: 2-keto-4-pentenoate hydratase [unclassified Sphingomonas]KQN37421.1 2-keto-4-pentenoate hydratase [Sphingomonas sp. Leaf42]KQT27790.1 2-keto-4-pentenoate hydratase [Sphingomonas sp. Leaf407]